MDLNGIPKEIPHNIAQSTESNALSESARYVCQNCSLLLDQPLESETSESQTLRSINEHLKVLENIEPRLVNIEQSMMKLIALEQILQNVTISVDRIEERVTTLNKSIVEQSGQFEGLSNLFDGIKEDVDNTQITCKGLQEKNA